MTTAHRINPRQARFIIGQLDELLLNRRHLLDSKHDLENLVPEESRPAACLWWWRLYDRPITQLVGASAQALGWSDIIGDCAKAENPNKAFLEAAQSDELQDDFDESSQSARVLLINTTVALAHSAAAISIFNISMDRLLKQAEQGDQIAFFHAMQIDPMVQFTDAGQGMLIDAHLRGDVEFVRKCFAGRKEPHATRKQHQRLRFCTALLDEMEMLDELDYQALHAFLTEVGVAPSDDPKYTADKVREYRALSTLKFLGIWAAYLGTFDP